MTSAFDEKNRIMRYLLTKLLEIKGRDSTFIT